MFGESAPAVDEAGTCRRVLPKLARHDQSSFTQYREADYISRAAMLPDEIIAQLNTEYQCREHQIRQLAALYAVRMISPTSDDLLTIAVPSPITTISQRSWPHSNGQNLGSSIVLPPLGGTAYHRQCPRMHHCTTPVGAHGRILPRCARRVQ